jgi:hypothetical protein
MTTPPPGCVDADVIELVLRLPEDHPRWRHLRECPRCRALLDSYRSFVDGQSDVAVAELETADARIGLALAHAIGVAPRARVAAASATRSLWLEWLTQPAVRPAMAAVALGLALLAAALWPRTTERHSATLPPPPVAVETPAADDVTATAGTIAIREPRFGADGVALSWQPWPGADRYEVRLYSGGLQPLWLSPTVDTTMFIARGELPSRATGQTLQARIYAYAGTSAVSASPMVSIGGEDDE